MKTTLRLAGFLAGAIALASCGDGSPEARVDDVDQLLARICGVAAECPGLSPTEGEIAQCPLELRSELSASQLTELQRFLGYTGAQQTCILSCIGGRICDRFGGGLNSISDSDVIEPYRACETQCL